MAFVLRGEIDIDGRKGTVVLKGLQREATRTSQAFDRAGSSTSKLVASFLKANSAASVFGTSLRALGRFGGAGILGAGAATALNRFGEAVKKNATDYFQAQKSLSDAFEISFKSKSVEEAQKGLEQTSNIIDELRGKITQLGKLGDILGGFERATGLNIFGVEDTRKAINSAKQNLGVQEELLKARQNEAQIARASQDRLNSEKTASALRKIANSTDEIRTGKESSISNAKEDLAIAILTTREIQYQIEEIFRANGALQNGALIDKLRNDLAEANLSVQQKRFALIKAQNTEEKRAAEQAAKTGQERFTRGGQGAEFLLQGRPGEQALGLARRRRQIETARENFRLREATLSEMANKATAEEGITISKQDIRKRLAAQQAAQEMPLMAQRVMAEEAGISPELVAAGVVAQKQGATATGSKEAFGGVIESLKKAIENLGKKLPAAVPQ
jgi:hypothetical protein